MIFGDRGVRCAPSCRWLTPLIALAVAGCGDSGTGPIPAPDLDALFAPPSEAEIATVEADWAARNPVPGDIQVELDSLIDVGVVSTRLRILSHTVPGGGRHYGALLTPDPAPVENLPVLVYAHGGDGGTNVSELLLIEAALRTEGLTVAFVQPSFRGESIRIGAREYVSDGAGSPWDRDVDDALALLTAALDLDEKLDPTRVGVLGLSRGAAVGLLMAARETLIDAVVAFFGPTDFFGSYVREIVEEILAGELRNLPGLDRLDATVIQPWIAGTLSTAEARLEMLRRSSVYFVDRLPPVQLHHGTADVVVDVSQAERLIEVMDAAGKTEAEFEGYLYEGGGHNAFTLLAAVDRTADFLFEHLIGLPLLAVP